MYDDNAPMIFVETLSGIAGSGANSILCFAVDVPAPDNSSKSRRVNLRVVIPHAALVQSVDWLTKAIQNPAPQAMEPPKSMQ